MARGRGGEQPAFDLGARLRKGSGIKGDEADTAEEAEQDVSGRVEPNVGAKGSSAYALGENRGNVGVLMCIFVCGQTGDGGVVEGTQRELVRGRPQLRVLFLVKARVGELVAQSVEGRALPHVHGRRGDVARLFHEEISAAHLVVSHREYEVSCLLSNRPFFAGDRDAQDLCGGPD